MYLQKVICQKTLKKFFFVVLLKITDENSRIRVRRGKDPRIRIRTKISRVRNIGFKFHKKVFKQFSASGSVPDLDP
jgi:hypothetical protein